MLSAPKACIRAGAWRASGRRAAGAPVQAKAIAAKTAGSIAVEYPRSLHSLVYRHTHRLPRGGHRAFEDSNPPTLALPAPHNQKFLKLARKRLND
eukprot:5275467-Prymnesium_polylepis.1